MTIQEEIEDIHQHHKSKKGTYHIDLRILKYNLGDILQHYITVIEEINEPFYCSVCKKQIQKYHFFIDDILCCSITCIQKAFNRLEKNGGIWIKKT